MTLDRLGVVQACLQAAPDDVTAGRSDPSLARPLWEMLAALAAPDFEVAMVGIEGTPGSTFQGVAGVFKSWADWLGPWESYSVHPDEVIEGRDTVVVLARQVGRPRGSSGTVEQRAAMVWRFRGDQVTRIEFHLDPERALASAGIERDR
jgi:ketosteroid isomerase-like protein